MLGAGEGASRDCQKCIAPTKKRSLFPYKAVVSIYYSAGDFSPVFFSVVSTPAKEGLERRGSVGKFFIRAVPRALLSRREGLRPADPSPIYPRGSLRGGQAFLIFFLQCVIEQKGRGKTGNHRGAEIAVLLATNFSGCFISPIKRTKAKWFFFLNFGKGVDWEFLLQNYAPVCTSTYCGKPNRIEVLITHFDCVD